MPRACHGLLGWDFDKEAGRNRAPRSGSRMRVFRVKPSPDASCLYTRRQPAKPCVCAVSPPRCLATRVPALRRGRSSAKCRGEVSQPTERGGLARKLKPATLNAGYGHAVSSAGPPGVECRRVAMCMCKLTELLAVASSCVMLAAASASRGCVTVSSSEYAPRIIAGQLQQACGWSWRRQRARAPVTYCPPVRASQRQRQWRPGVASHGR